MLVTAMEPDYTIEDHGTVALCRPRNDHAHDNLTEGAGAEALWYGDALAVEARYVVPLAESLAEEGWLVEII